MSRSKLVYKVQTCPSFYPEASKTSPYTATAHPQFSSKYKKVCKVVWRKSVFAFATCK